MGMYRGIVLLISCLFLSVSVLAVSKSDSLRKLLLEREEEAKSEVLLKLQEHYFYQNLDSALHYGYLARGKAEVYEQETEGLRAIVGLGLAYFLQGNQENCDQYWQQADSIIAKASKIDTKTYYHYYKGIIHLYKSRLDSSFFHFNKTIRLARESNNTKLWVRSLQNSGNVFFYKGQFTLALKYYKESNAAADSCNDIRVKVYSTFNIANIYRRKTEFEKSHKWFREAQVIASQIHDYNLMGNICNNKALNHTH